MSIRSTAENAVILQVSQLGQSFVGPEGEIELFSHLHLTLNSGETLAIMGQSGSGKSSLLSILAGLSLPTRGEVKLLGKNIGNTSEDERAQLRLGQVGFIFQFFHLMPGLSALDNVQLLLQGKEAKAQAQDWLTKVGLAKRMHHFPHQLSGGERQRVALARALVTHPKILFADEPTGNLDHATAERMEKLLFDMVKQTGVALVLVTHDQKLAMACDRRLQLVDGQLVEML